MAANPQNLGRGIGQNADAHLAVQGNDTSVKMHVEPVLFSSKTGTDNSVRVTGEVRIIDSDNSVGNSGTQINCVIL